MPKVEESFCSKCARGFSRPCDLRRHLKSHDTDSRSFYCDFPGCGYQARKKATVEFHSNSKHTNKTPFRCSYSSCTRQFANPTARSRHHKKDHEQLISQSSHNRNAKTSSSMGAGVITSGEQVTYPAVTLTVPTQTQEPTPPPTNIVFPPFTYTLVSPDHCPPDLNPTPSTTASTNATLLSCPADDDISSTQLTTGLVLDLNNAGPFWSPSSDLNTENHIGVPGLGQDYTSFLSPLDSGSDFVYSPSYFYDFSLDDLHLPPPLNSSALLTSDTSSLVTLTPQMNSLDFDFESLDAPIQDLFPTSAASFKLNPQSVQVDPRENLDTDWLDWLEN